MPNKLARCLRSRVGRLLNDKMPTGVAVSPAMNHGGPYPATGHPGFTAVGIPASIHRFAMLQCFDNVRPHRLPACLGDKSPQGTMWRCIDGQWTQERCSQQLTPTGLCWWAGWPPPQNCGIMRYSLAEHRRSTNTGTLGEGIDLDRSACVNSVGASHNETHRRLFRRFRPDYGRGWSCLLRGANGVSVLASRGGPPRKRAARRTLDRATLVKLSAKSMCDLETASNLCESALKKGVDAGNESYAKEFLTATLYEHAARLSRLIFEQRPIDPRWPRVRQLAMKDLERALEVDPEMASVQLLIGRLQSLPGGDDDRARQAAAAAVELLEESDDAEQLSAALVLRGRLTQDPEAILADLNRALELDPRNVEAWRIRAALQLARGENDKALEDFQMLLPLNPDDMTAHQAVAQALRNLKQFDQAMEHLDRVIEANPVVPTPYILRAHVLEEMGKLPEAVKSLDEAVTVKPEDLNTLVFRARLQILQNEYDLAREDVEQALKLQPQFPQAVLLRSLISAAQERFGEAINDLRPLVRRNPENIELKLQLATYYEADRRLTSAIQLYSEIVEADPDQWLARRRRGDAYLSQGKQGEALKDYETALELQPEDSGILNNLAWVLATSPDDDLRDGSRSFELAQTACELTEYQQAHILSTLAASYAEMGDFEEAVQWSHKAVELDPDEEQLSKELASYQDQQPWRERQQVEENTEPLPVVTVEPEPMEGLPFDDEPEEADEPDAEEADENPVDPAASSEPIDEPPAGEWQETLDKVDAPRRRLPALDKVDGPPKPETIR